MAGFLSSDDPFPITAGSEALFSPGALASTIALEPSPSSHARPQVNEPPSSTRKRARISASPAPQHSVLTPEAQSQNIATKISSDNPNHIVEALNKLLELSADHDINFALGKQGGKIADKLVHIFDETIGWKHGNTEIEIFLDDPNEEDDISDLIPSAKMWEHGASPSTVGDQDLDDFDWKTFCATKFAPTSLNTAMNPSHVNPKFFVSEDELKRLEIIIMIVRNLSYGEIYFWHLVQK